MKKNTTLESMKKTVLEFSKTCDLGQQITYLFNCLDDVLYFVKDRKGRFVTCNEVFAKAMGCSKPEDLFGKTDYDFFNKEIADAFVTDDLFVMEQGGIVKNRMEILPNSTQTFDWVQSNKIPLKDKDGNIIGLAGITSKISKNNMPVGYSKEVYLALDYINENYMRKITLKDIAAICHLSIRSLERSFKDNFQTTFRKYLHQVRMNAVCRDLVYSSADISKIAHDNGFFDQSHLTVIFSKSLGMTPRQYRLKHGQGTSRK